MGTRTSEDDFRASPFTMGFAERTQAFSLCGKHFHLLSEPASLCNYFKKSRASLRNSGSEVADLGIQRQGSASLY